MENVSASYLDFTFFKKKRLIENIAFLQLTHVDFLNGKEERSKFRDLSNISAFSGNSVITLTDLLAVRLARAIKYMYFLFLSIRKQINFVHEKCIKAVDVYSCNIAISVPSQREA